MGEVEEDREVAESIARTLRGRTGRRGGWYEVRALMAEFGIERLSSAARDRMTRGLADAGLTVDPSLDDVDRRDTVVLSNGSPGTNASGHADTLRRVLSVRVAVPGEPVRRVELEHLDQLDGSGVRWFDVAATSEVDPAELLAALDPHCGGRLVPEMIEDLVSPDPRPKVQPWAGGGIRGVAAFRVTASESDEGAEDGSQSKAGVLVFEPVEFLVGADWVITCWHDAEVFRGADRIGEREPAPGGRLFAEVERHWAAGGVSSAGDLAVLVLNELALSYAAAYRQLYVWEDEWELDFFRRPDRIDRDTLLEIRAEAAVMRDWLTPLNPPGLRQDVGRAWFPGVTGTRESGGYAAALRIDDRVDRALDGLREFNQTLRSAYDLLLLREGERERHRDERFQRTVAVGGSAILIPTLVAGIMGANTWVPGEAGPGSSHWAFAVLLVVLAMSGAIAWIVLRRLRDRDDTR